MNSTKDNLTHDELLSCYFKGRYYVNHTMIGYKQIKCSNSIPLFQYSFFNGKFGPTAKNLFCKFFGKCEITENKIAVLEIKPGAIYAGNQHTGNFCSR